MTKFADGLDTSIVVLNVIAIIVLARKHFKKSEEVSFTDRTLLSLSVADLVVGGYGLFYSRIYDIFSPETIKKYAFITKYNHQLFKVTLAISAFHLSLLAIERLLSVYKPLLYRYSMRKRHAITAIILAWLASILTVFVAVEVGINITDNRADNWLFAIVIGSCTIFVVVSYCLIYTIIRRKHRNLRAVQEGTNKSKATQAQEETTPINNEASNQENSINIKNIKDNEQNNNTDNNGIKDKKTKKVENRQSSLKARKEKNVLYLGICISLAFVVCFMPYIFLGAVFVYTRQLHNTFLTVIAIARANSLINPLILFWFHYGLPFLRRRRTEPLSKTNSSNIGQENVQPKNESGV